MQKTLKKVIKSYDVIYPDAICVKKGEVVSVIKRETKLEWKGWVFCKTDAGKTGWISENYLEFSGEKARAVMDYDAREVSVNEDEYVTVVKVENGWAWVKKQNGSDGWVPIENLEL